VGLLHEVKRPVPAHRGHRQLWEDGGLRGHRLAVQRRECELAGRQRGQADVLAQIGGQPVLVEGVADVDGGKVDGGAGAYLQSTEAGGAEESDLRWRSEALVGAPAVDHQP